MKDLKLEGVGLKIDSRIIIDSINTNEFNWQLDKTLEECVELADAIIHYKRDERANEQMCMEIGDMFIQIAILEHLFSREMIQKCINRKLISIDKRNKRINDKPLKNVGFQL